MILPHQMTRSSNFNRFYPPPSRDRLLLMFLDFSVTENTPMLKVRSQVTYLKNEDNSFKTLNYVSCPTWWNQSSFSGKPQVLRKAYYKDISTKCEAIRRPWRAIRNLIIFYLIVFFMYYIKRYFNLSHFYHWVICIFIFE